jgi:hypothetical protein
MTLPSSVRMPALRCRLSGEPGMARVCGGRPVQRQARLPRAPVHRGTFRQAGDAGGSGGFKNLEGAAYIQVKEIVRIFLAAIFMDAVPGGDVDDAIAATIYLPQLRPVQNGSFDKQRSLFQVPGRANIENNRYVAPVE